MNRVPKTRGQIAQGKSDSNPFSSKLMLIKFLCPNGHQLATRPERAGKPGKCPKCGTAFVVPDVDTEDGDGHEHAGGQQVSQVEVGSGTDLKKAADQQAAAGGSDVIVFLCPNGHKLNGPAYLQGRPGQCPHCGERFLIPAFDEQEESPIMPGSDTNAAADSDVAGAMAKAAAESGFHGAQHNTTHHARPHHDDVEEVDEIEEVESEGDWQQGPAALGHNNEPPHALAGIFMHLWSQCNQRDMVKVHMDDGEVLSPQFFSAALSQTTHGVFAIQEEDRTYTLVTVPWKSVTQVSFRKVDQLPEGLFQ